MMGVAGRVLSGLALLAGVIMSVEKVEAVPVNPATLQKATLAAG